MLLPLPESCLLSLDLLSEPLPELLFLLFELGVVQFLDLGFPELACLHLLLAVILVMQLLARRNEVQHVGADQQRPQLLEVTVVLILNCRVRIRLSLEHWRIK